MCFLKLLSNAHFLARQGLAFCRDGNKSNYNFIILLDLRSSMTHQQVNHLMLSHIHKCDHTNSLDFIDVANDFIDGNTGKHRNNFLGSEFKQTDRD